MPELRPDAWAHIRYAYEHTDRPVEDICTEQGISSGTLRDRVRRWRWTRRRPPIPREGPPPITQREIVSPPPVRTANGGEGSGVGGLNGAQTSEAIPPTPLRLAGASRSDPPHRHSASKTRVNALMAGGGMADAAALPAVSEMDKEKDEFEAAPVHPTPPVFANAQTVDPPPPGEGEEAAAIVPRLQSAVARVLPAIEATIARLAAGPHHPREMEQAGRALGALTRTLRELNALLSQHHAQAGGAYDDDMPEDMDAFREALARRIEAFMESRSGDGAEEQEA